VNRAVAWKLLDENPAKRGVPNPGRRCREQRPFDSWARIRSVAERLGPMFGPMVVSAAATGLRKRSGSSRCASSTTCATPTPPSCSAPRVPVFALSRFMGTSIAMIDLHYGHLALDSYRHAVSLLDALAPSRCVTWHAGVAETRSHGTCPPPGSPKG
jgi:hypothetical protein